MSRLKKIHLKKNREKSVLHRHPWVFSGAIDHVDPSLQDGEMASLCQYNGRILGTGYYNSSSNIRVRILSFGETPVDKDFFHTLITRAVDKRYRHSALIRSTAFRLLNGEGDGLPGIVADIYNSHLVIQIITKGIEILKESIIEMLIDASSPESVYERSDHSGRALEGLSPRCGQLFGNTPQEIVINESGMNYSVDVHRGQKTGFYLDQRENRRLVRDISKGRRVLNLFSYTGGFTIAAMAGGAVETISVDSSSESVGRIKNNIDLNSITAPAQYHTGDVFDFVRMQEITSDLIIIDPPALAKHKGAVADASRGYKDLNLQVAKKCPPSSLLLSCSCSRFIDMDLFQKIVFSAMADAGRHATIMAKTHHPFDHPVNIYCPETAYLKALLLQID